MPTLPWQKHGQEHRPASNQLMMHGKCTADVSNKTLITDSGKEWRLWAFGQQCLWLLGLLFTDTELSIPLCLIAFLIWKFGEICSPTPASPVHNTSHVCVRLRSQQLKSDILLISCPVSKEEEVEKETMTVFCSCPHPVAGACSPLAYLGCTPVAVVELLLLLPLWLWEAQYLWRILQNNY